MRFWEVLANVRWAVIALQQSDRYLIQGARDLVTAIIGRRATECELEMLMLLDPDGASASWRTVHHSACEPAGCRQSDPPASAICRAAPACWRSGANMLLEQILPLLPPERHRELRLVATAMAIAEREAAAGDAPAQEIAALLRELYRTQASRSGEEPRSEMPAIPKTTCCAASPPTCAPAHSSDASRAGGCARAILWRLTILKLREGNPGFLAENGFGE